MPCDSIVTTKTEFLATSTDVALLKAALEAMGYTVSEYRSELSFYKNGRRGSYQPLTGKLTMPEEWDGNDIKRGYAEQVVSSQLKRQGWKFEWTTNAQGIRECTPQKRGS